jgi:hypothetical protein
MLGLRFEADQNQGGIPGHYKKTYRFAEKLHGRFFISGISGGFEKYTKEVLKKGDTLPPKKQKYDYQPVLEKHQREELRKEAERLMELEVKLKEVKVFLFFQIGLLTYSN